jgi:hypothetical protein
MHYDRNTLASFRELQDILQKHQDNKQMMFNKITNSSYIENLKPNSLEIIIIFLKWLFRADVLCIIYMIAMFVLCVTFLT